MKLKYYLRGMGIGLLVGVLLHAEREIHHQEVHGMPERGASAYRELDAVKSVEILHGDDLLGLAGEHYHGDHRGLEGVRTLL